ncbi:MAG: hypothetical protein A2821_02400 [Candidatus Magasanikbacteria bacterium RIFCSPHIGHO2_01_FULL_41_23]|uniref:Addiction module toxin RelE n=1 Tax=Candidatus Magasanikbacteria bacterium RIFCSPLOWO2_01_FULL_40_15 TaxID=1798686 RepID=A0A1F6N2L8_9BACT|nr:MAG: hypothetical protein A2821_02400 [Candidatus Magasanikbacteria bacterium RIFCSPHIGHO2_01_FULL_41_23]OGH66864.1 MAG: hypothetical protein A3C66_02185 [Candidatus Magasanikbacteria bacterium RIFCSPHIGHO2_02_FULL_41_35]OGH74847.1 MAG: hypothetical protein A3F22_04110 [Candidatus Magasanikbacteria bacterium RIFCSPHIGHO2_12_FULL_41_16]OGH78122.1 MAG: hypothetical protein A2983_03535 [Candidatus Magasanikbacteria bacterium RIFCSPLOWO2_01_FULL_40_15]
MNMEVQFFDKKIEEFIDHLDNIVNPKVFRVIALLEEFGPSLGMPQSKKIGQRLFELRILGKQHIRIIYTFHRDSAILLHGFIKKSEKIPLKEICLAKAKLSVLDRR